MAQLVHIDADATPEYCPAGQLLHATEGLAVNCPGVHGVHVVACAALHDPDGHVAQGVVTEAVAVPAAQMTHAE